eukprot:521042-Pyramimonas_sp.AAC.1
MPESLIIEEPLHASRGGRIVKQPLELNVVHVGAASKLFWNQRAQRGDRLDELMRCFPWQLGVHVVDHMLSSRLRE